MAESTNLQLQIFTSLFRHIQTGGTNWAPSPYAYLHTTFFIIEQIIKNQVSANILYGPVVTDVFSQFHGDIPHNFWVSPPGS